MGKMKIMSRLTVPIILIFVAMQTISGCALFKPIKREPEKKLLPGSYSSGPNQWEPSRRWWQKFNDPQLNLLVEEALRQNLSLQQSWARLRQVRALAVKSGADLYPDLALNAGASTGRRRAETTETVESYSLGLSTNYEIDLWGRIRSEQQAALLEAAASREDLNAAAITLSANVASRWIGIISQRMQKKLLLQQLEANLTLLELVELRFRKSLASALDVFQQRQVVAQSRAQLPLVEQTERQLLNELTVLLGRAPFALPRIQSQSLEIPTEVPSTGLPVQLLTARPDIQAALRRLEAADWSTAAAQADRLPNIGITAGATYQAEELSLIFDNWLINVAANLTAPLIDGRRRQAEVERLKAVVAENLAAYRQTILEAMREVEDALVSEEKLREHLKGLRVQRTAAQNALNEARYRYRNGLEDYLPVLTQLLTVQALERTEIQRKADLLAARIDLHRGLGGTWTDALSPHGGVTSPE